MNGIDQEELIRIGGVRELTNERGVYSSQG